MPPSHVRTSRAPLTRDAVLAVAREMVVADGLQGVSLRKIAARLGVTAPALYAHVDGKDALLRALTEEEFERLIVELGDAADGHDDPLERIRAQSRAYVLYALANPTLFQVMFLFRPDWAGTRETEELPLASKAFALAAAAVEDAIADGSIRERDPLMASLTIWAAVHGVASVLLAAPSLGDAYERALVDSVINNVLAGLAHDQPTTPEQEH